MTLCTPRRSFAAGETLILHLGFHSVIANRVVYTLEEAGREAFGYGTLTGHASRLDAAAAGGRGVQLGDAACRHLLYFSGAPVPAAPVPARPGCPMRSGRP
ncbi:DUF1990 family protein [Deinococcus sp.]|uniref:DUF1990 family protein n=1 Tax=Deinococcus sp. TaxID=47478 RepID=UPI0038D3D4BB